MKKILVVTGTSDNKRNFAVNYIAEFMKEKEVEAEVVGESIYDVTEVAEDISAIVAIGQHPLYYEIQHGYMLPAIA